MSQMLAAMLWAAFAGAAIPAGALLARFEHIRPHWLEREFRHSVIAFGGGALLAAVSLILVPEGMASVPVALALLAFVGGGVTFFLVERGIERQGSAAGQALAMVLDYVPESLALGAAFVTQPSSGILLAILIMLQNVPEGFNAYRELMATGRHRPLPVLLGLCALILLGPAAAWVGFTWLSGMDALLGSILLFAAGGILYLVFEDVAPQAKLERHWAPPLGAVAGFALGLAGHAFLA